MQFEKNLALLRKKNNLSQEELAFAIGVSRQTIYSWEAGLNYPNIIMLKKIGEVLNVTTDDLLNGFEVNKLPNSLKELKLTKLCKHEGVVNYEELPNWFIKLKPEEEICWAIYDIKKEGLIKDYSYQVYTRGGAVIHDIEGIEIEVKEYDEKLTLSRIYSQFVSLNEKGVAWIGQSSIEDGKKIIKTYKDQSFLDGWGINGKFGYQKTNFNDAEDYLLEINGKKYNVIKISYFNSIDSNDSKKQYIEVFLNQNFESLVWRRYTKTEQKNKNFDTQILIENEAYNLDYYVVTSRII